MSDPRPEERVYYRNIDSGQRAYVVMREGEERLRLDHGPNVDVVVPLDGSRWTIDRDVRPINRAHLAEVAFSADRALCLRLHRHEEARVQWRDLRDVDRAQFIEEGPKDAERIRMDLFKAIRGALAPYTSK